MQIFYYMGNNPRNKSGVSWKVWKIHRTGKTVTTQWGPAEVKNRIVVAKGKLQAKERRFSSLEEARVHEQQRITSKLRKGYESKPRTR
jgi:predicted DNA-binding WGR domain protein